MLNRREYFFDSVDQDRGDWVIELPNQRVKLAISVSNKLRPIKGVAALRFLERALVNVLDSSDAGPY
jgi:hypothetical protein